MPQDEAMKAVRGFSAHGVVFHEPIGDQVVGDCPFTGKTRKFYVNWKTKLWDSKVAGLSGNFQQFLEAIAKENHEAYLKNPDAIGQLARDRQLPRSAFVPLQVGFDGTHYTIPIRNSKGTVVDLRLTKLGKKSMSTPSASTGLLGHEQLADPKRKAEPVYIVEGEWDWAALHWLLRKLGKPGIVVGLPGANTFKTEWVPSFKDRTVAAFYDNDEAGEQGELRCFELLSTSARSLKFCRWPVDLPDGFDIRDWIRYGAFKKKTPRKCWSAIEMLFKPQPRRSEKKVSEGSSKEGEEKGPALEPITRVELFVEFRKWLHMKDDTALAIVFGTMFANRLQGDPLWVFIVAPPGGMKSELLMSLSLADAAYSCSSLTPHALVSGASWVGGEDPSLIPKLDGKVLIIKDFTTTLSMHPMARDEIFGQLRDCYDGKFEKQFGNGVVRRYKSTFGILAGVTPNIDAFSSLHQGLGERFLKFRLEGNTKHEDEEERILRAISNINREVAMRDRLQEASARYLANPMPDALPELAPEMSKRIAKLSMLSSRMRGVVNRDRYNTSLLTSKASYEIGTRLGKQFSKLAIGISCYYGEDKVSDRTYKLVIRVAMSTVPDKIEEVIRTLWRLTPEEKDSVRTKDIFGTGEELTQSTVFRTLQDLAMIGVVKQEGSGTKYSWSLSKEMRRFIKESECYETISRSR